MRFRRGTRVSRDQATDPGRRALISAPLGSVALIGGLVPEAPPSPLISHRASDFGIANDGTDVSGALNALLSTVEWGRTIVFEPGHYGLAEPVLVRPRSGVTSGLTITGTRGAIFEPLRKMDSLFVLTGDQVEVSRLSFVNRRGFAKAAFSIHGSGTNGRHVRFTYNTFTRFSWAIESSAADRVETAFNDCLLSTEGFLIAKSNGMDSTHLCNFVLGGRYGFYFTHSELRNSLQGQPAEGVRLISNTLHCTAPEAQAIVINGGTEYHIDHNMIDQTGPRGIGISIIADRYHPVSGLKLGSNWVAGGVDGVAIRSRGPVRNLLIGPVTLVGKTVGGKTIGLDLSGASAFRIDGANTVGISGMAARFSNCSYGEIRSTDFRAGAGVHEDAECTILWIGGNRQLPPENSRSPRSRYALNF
jgi:hypothetical protein